MNKQGSQRYYCRACRRYFRQNPQLPEGRTDYRKRAGKLPSAGQLILELHAVAQRIGRTPTTAVIAEMSKKGRTHSLNTYYAVFGSFLTAVKRAKLPPRYKQEFSEDDKERMLDELRSLGRKLKRPIYDADVDEARRKGRISPPYHFKLAFGSVPAAIAAAGAGDKKWTREELIRYLNRLKINLGREVMKQDVEEEFRRGRGPSIKVITRNFGGIVNARRARK